MGGIVDGALGGAIGTGIVGLFVLFVWLPLVKTFKDPSKAGFQAMRQMLKTEWSATQRYKSILGRSLDWVAHFFDGDTVNPSPWSAGTYDRLLWLAIAYPILSAFLIWVGSGEAGNLSVAFGMLTDADWVTRLLSLIAQLMMIFGVVFFDRFKGWKGISIGTAFIFLPFVLFPVFTFAGSIIVAFAVVGAVNRSVAIAIVFVFAFSITFIFSVSLTGMIVVALFVAVILAVATVIAGVFSERTARHGLFLSVVFVGYFVAIFVVLVFMANEKADDRAFALIVGLGLVPLVNVVFDWLSLGLTRLLLRENLSDISSIWPTVRSLLDFGGATVLLILLAVTLVSVLTLVDQIGYAKGMTTAIVGVDAVLADILLEPAAARHWWIYFTLFSTLIPTFIHGVIWVGSLLSVRPKIIDRWILREMNEVAATEDPEDRIGHARRAAAMVLGQWAVATFLVGAACYLIWTAADHLTGAGELLLTLLIWVQEITAAGAAWVLW